jgi:transposase InsO family protein
VVILGLILLLRFGIECLRHCAWTSSAVLLDFCQMFSGALRSRSALIAENLFLRKQLALFQERKAKPHRANDATRWLLAILSRFFDWRSALVVVKPATLIRWHRQGFRFFWRWKSKPTGRPKLPKDLRQLIRKIASENPSWGQERIANELELKLGVSVSPRTVQKYLSENGPRRVPDPQQRWLTFVRNHAKVTVACDFFTVVTASFRVLYVFLVMEHSRRKILHFNVTSHPTADWTVQQFREALPGGHSYEYLIHDLDSIFSRELDRVVKAMGVRVLRTPVRSPKANALCERLVGTIRRECLDSLIPLNERHLKLVLNTWVPHYNRGRPHMSLGPGFPVSLPDDAPENSNHHKLRAGHRVRSKPILGGLHHEYWLEKVAA